MLSYGNCYEAPTVSHLTWNPPRQHAVAAAIQLPEHEPVITQNKAQLRNSVFNYTNDQAEVSNSNS